MRLQKHLLCIACIFLLAAACDPIFTTSIGKIIQNPRDYGGKRVTISGEVTEIFSFFVIKCFMVRDSTGELTVVTTPFPGRLAG